MLIVCIVSVFFVSPSFKLPAFTGWTVKLPEDNTMFLFPFLFVTVACGACSGFHSLVSSGTTAKQVANEKHIFPISYGGMLLEGILAILAVTSVAVLSKNQFHTVMSSGSPVAAFARGLAGLSVHLGIPFKLGLTFLSLTIAAFMLTSLDTATRLARFTWQELFIKPSDSLEKTKDKVSCKVFSNSISATLIVVVVAGYLAFSGNGKELWPIFGASNQLLASLTLLIVTMYLIRKKANFWIAFIPMLLMLITSIWALIVLLAEEIQKDIFSGLIAATAFLIIMSMILVVKSIISLKKATN